ncbi:hypothetical protein GWI33_007524 [Rhynchophorus ferrugineus]|uniref:Uncharacterized protein n=1 Tax=Rhynchophorus ferrugineus TaxID=354439 RepID=A0A834MC10_RHYFE|nr:hypothetical protein GWI33_007524 [Rhynchophorus ferrugineus]
MKVVRTTVWTLPTGRALEVDRTETGSKSPAGICIFIFGNDVEAVLNRLYSLVSSLAAAQARIHCLCRATELKTTFTASSVFGRTLNRELNTTEKPYRYQEEVTRTFPSNDDELGGPHEHHAPAVGFVN